MMKIENAKIVKFEICIDFGLVADVRFEGNCWVQSLCYHFLGNLENWHEQPNYAAWFINRVLSTAGVRSVEKVVGSPVRIMSEDGYIKAFGHYIEDRWFNPSEELESLTI